MKQVIGIDIGGTKITGIVYDGRKVIGELTIKTPKTLFELERNLYKLIDFLSSDNKIFGIGVGSAGTANTKTGWISFSSNIFRPRKGLNLVKLLKARYKVGVKIDNDTSCFTRAEMLLGQGKNYTDFLGVILGTGVGGGIVADKKLYRGFNNGGAEFGHMVFDKGFFEEHYFQPARRSNNYKLLAKQLGRFFASLVNLFAPQAIILGGGVSLNAGKKFLPGAKREMKNFLYNPEAQPKILVSKLKNAGALGAALMLVPAKAGINKI